MLAPEERTSTNVRPPVTYDLVAINTQAVALFKTAPTSRYFIGSISLSRVFFLLLPLISITKLTKPETGNLFSSRSSNVGSDAASFRGVTMTNTVLKG